MSNKADKTPEQIISETVANIEKHIPVDSEGLAIDKVQAGELIVGSIDALRNLGIKMGASMRSTSQMVNKNPARGGIDGTG